ncbi:guanylate kinase [Spirulina sp. CS-785/01]|uniref:guanylate kinase n=1 Tax=Spirulina sp. CS-785/01 TaxID=3021716 RepID=UPI00232CCF6C|nr:guanylate kinase [Spirulina sp. CS-785/01]MDB9312626.1 guanylate kinase [Spirulina sp. CS-785/01]
MTLTQQLEPTPSLSPHTLRTTGKLVVLTGPSGVGKGTLVKALLHRHPDLYLSVSATTRPPREGEKQGRDYYFVSRGQFQAMIQEGELLEWAEYAGNYYGTPRHGVNEQIADGKTVLLEIELVGARLVKKTFPEAYSIFILPPSVDELERRLRDRGTDSNEVIEKRLHRAKTELSATEEFDAQVVNDDLEQALAQLEQEIFG